MSRPKNDLSTIARFGEKLRSLRMRQSLTLQQLVRELGLTSHSHLSELENGKKLPTADLALKVARFFEVTTDQLLKDELELPAQQDP